MKSIERIDGSLLNLRISKPVGSQKVGIVLYIDGSLCLPSVLPLVLREDPPVGDEWEEQAERLSGIATLIVEKPGVSVAEVTDGELRIDSNHSCSEDFLKYYSMEQRVLDHLRALQYLRARADWWNGELYIWGFSDGGAIGARVASYSERARRVVLTGFGGGLPFTTLWEDYFLCADRKGDERTACVDELRAQFKEMRSNPSTAKTWMGSSNTWKTWAGRLDSVPARILFDAEFPILLVHGVEDRSVPVDSARSALHFLDRPGGPEVEYWEVPGMKHSAKSLSEEREIELEWALLRWLLLGSEGKERPGWIAKP